MEDADRGVPVVPLHFEVQEGARSVVLSVAGEVDCLTVARLRAAIEGAISRLGDRVLVLNLDQVTFLGSPGLHVLATTAYHLQQEGSPDVLRVVTGGRRLVRRTIEITGLDAILGLYDSLDRALAE
jgi:anti-sigma B factor antagonist